jgi:HK97 gp10 family phage protein
MAFSIKIEGLDKLQEGFIKAPQEMVKDIQEAVRDAGTVIYAQEVKEAPSATSNLRGSIQMDLHPMSAEIYPTAKYAPYVNFGTKPHVIEPKNGKVLAFKSGGKLIFARKVNHPGTKANPFMERTVEKVTERVGQIFQKVVDKAINILSGK